MMGQKFNGYFCDKWTEVKAVILYISLFTDTQVSTGEGIL